MQQLMNVRGAWSGLPVRARIAIVGVVAVTLMVMFLVVRAATGTAWVAATPELSAEKLGRAETVLDDASIAHQLSASGRVIEVAEADQPKAAAALVAAGIAAKGDREDCAAASKKGSGMIAQTSAAHALQLETCSENQVANMLEGFSGIEHATVDATLPAATLFEDEQDAAKAAVVLDTGGTGLSKKTIAGIQETVAAAFPGLKPGGVTVADETGRVVGGDDDGGSTMSKLDAEGKLNAKIEHDLGAQIERLVGPDNFVLTSNVELDMDQIERNVVENTPAGPDGTSLVQREQFNKELLNGGAGTDTGGTTGSASNTGTTSTTTTAEGSTTTSTDAADNRTVTGETTAADSSDSYVKDIGGVEYANNVVAEKIGVAPGAVIRFRLGAVIDDDVDPASANAAKNLLLSWMGGNAQDSLSFDQAPVAISETATTAGANATPNALAGYVKWVLLGMGLIGLAFVLRRTLTQRTAELLAPADDLLLLEGGDFTPIPIAELEAALAAGQPTGERRQRMDVQRKVEQIADAKPTDVASELRRWMQLDDMGYGSTGRKVG